ncbi:demethylmenaquinone methyltransferase/2-methoxy-6-polyprenyl-1,4-benzoquinol methylase [Actinomadura hallensis]|uniref:Demethylmenaquinone methyltransferase n=1 Tax=Actinomadura hallensis TaxID=337895 RepID=A0A543IMF9_9ACTN|nr:demethylmenaquinone methyltransferase [Actinomadura hallensis]TQM71760.1 demethylmenaquinone methyltransferase/2-methoxy-6-polyprenyl-1,4-benzoquinol methylase [Actinomadura hallensis]HLV74982.1 demethylmenaquinone methyltransferase [Vulgatibacteraceae bacterium]
MTRASLDKKPADVAAMFDGTAERYDLLNTLMTAGRDRRWRRETVRALGARPGERILDLAAGTGTSSVPFAEAGAHTVACDFSLGMLRVGVRRQRGVPRLGFVAGDALRLPFADGAFDGVTISFGLRNVADTGRALRELRRVTRPGGRLVVCEVSHPPNPLLALGHRAHLRFGLPLLARVSSNPDSYRYLAESTLAWPDQAALARLLQDAGWDEVRWRNLTFGVAALHRAVNPG